MVEYTGSGEIDLSVLEVAVVIDVEMLKKFLDNFALGMNCAAVSVDREGNEITAPSYYRSYCQDFIHKSPTGDKRCAECHNRMGEEAARTGKPFVGPCHAGLTDFAAPIIVNGQHLGTVLGGQIVDKPLDEKNVRNVAHETNLDADALWAATKKIDIVPKKNIDAAAEVLFIVVNAIAENGYRQLEIKHMSGELADNFIQISSTVDMLAESAQTITFNQQSLTEQIQSITATTEKITAVLKSIEQIANNIKMIGLNASIEAAHLGSAGAGFAVVAKEIQNLSQKSKGTANEIANMNEQITEIISSTLEKADNTLKTTEDQSAAMEELSATTQNVTTLAEKLKDLSN